MPVWAATMPALHVLIGPRSGRCFALSVRSASNRVAACVGSARRWRCRRIRLSELFGYESSALRLV
eukprot:3163771-Pleurochrysis_carterae.AAC.1